MKEKEKYVQLNVFIFSFSALKTLSICTCFHSEVKLLLKQVHSFKLGNIVYQSDKAQVKKLLDTFPYKTSLSV